MTSDPFQVSSEASGLLGPNQNGNKVNVNEATKNRSSELDTYCIFLTPFRCTYT